MTGNKSKVMLSLIIPLYNEEKNVVLLYYRLKEAVSELCLSYEIIFVDDGSIDNTYQLLRNLRSKDDKIIIIKFLKNFGQSAAFAAGFNIASGDFAITIDGDLQYDPKEIVLLWEIAQQGTDVVCGWRQTDNIYASLHRIPSIIANSLGAIIFGIKVHDFSCSFRAYSKTFYKSLYLTEGLHRFIPVFAKFKGMNIKEAKVSCVQRHKGVSKYNFLRFPVVIKDAIFLKAAELAFSGSYKHLFKKNNFVIESIQ